MKDILTTKTVAMTGILMALTVFMSSFGVPVPGGRVYLNDLIITFSAFVLAPLPAFIVGAFGSFLGDFFFYPTPMFVSFAVHGLQALVISLFVRHFSERKHFYFAVCLGIIINVVGYTLGRAFVYATIEAAQLKLPYQILQAGIGSILALLIYFRLPKKKYSL